MGDASSNINDAHFIFGHLHCSKVNVLNGNSRLLRGKQSQIVSLKFVKWSHQQSAKFLANNEDCNVSPEEKKFVFMWYFACLYNPQLPPPHQSETILAVNEHLELLCMAITGLITYCGLIIQCHLKVFYCLLLAFTCLLVHVAFIFIDRTEQTF